MELIKEGAEARLYKQMLGKRSVLVKERARKSYREKELDLKIRRGRTKREEKLLQTARRIGVKVPSVIEVNDCKIVMEFVPGKTLKQALHKNNTRLCVEMGKSIARMHSHNLIHGDLTTSNIILDKRELFFLDFGLGFNSSKLEDKAVDLLNLKKTFQATHSEFFEDGWQKIVQGYLKEGGQKPVIKQIEKVEKRARYKVG